MGDESRYRPPTGAILFAPESAPAALPFSVPAVHAITDGPIVAAPTFLARACAVLDALGAGGALHLRAPGLAGRALHGLVLALLPVAKGSGARIVVNDRVDVAAAAGAWGVQLTSRSLRVADARRVAAPGALALGASVHSPDEAAAAARAGAAWITAGHVFETATHAGQDGRGLDFLRLVVAAAQPVRVIAIGGVRPEHVALLQRAGAGGVAVIRGIWHARDAGRAASDYLAAHERARDDDAEHHDERTA